MSDKKHIDRIFQEKFKDFEVAPKDHVWKHIQKELELEEQDKKASPAWFKWASVAALLLLLLTVGTLVFKNPDQTPNQNGVVDTENPSNLEESNASENTVSNIETPINSSPTSNSNLTESSTDIDKVENNTMVETNHGVPSSKEEIPTVSNGTSHSKQVTSRATNTQINTINSSSVESSNRQGELTQNNLNKTHNKLANNTVEPNHNSKEQNKSFNNFQSTNNDPPKDSETTFKSQEKSWITENQPSDREFNKEQTIAHIDNDSTTVKVEPSIENFPEKEKENSIEEAIAEAEKSNEKDEKEKLTNRWQVYANIAPVYYNSFGDGSHIDEQFVGNSKTGEVNTSYGVNVGYAINEKLTIRTGVNSLKLSYDTNDVILYETPGNGSGGNQQFLRNLNMASGSEIINAISANNLGVQQVSELFNANAAISQRIGYYEVPLELEYTLVNKKFGIGLVGGFSTFFLNQNEVYSEFESYNTYIGEANNINNVSFSGNLGIGLDYNFSPKFKFNLEPVFKYQFGAYDNTSGNFNPYILGVYSGFSFKF